MAGSSFSDDGHQVMAPQVWCSLLDVTSDKPYGYIYVVQNYVNDKIYVGQSTDPVRRWSYHRSSANKAPRRGEGAVTKAIRKYGLDAFRMDLIWACDSQAELDECERILIAAWGTLTPNGYNLGKGGWGRGKHTEESKEKIRQASLAWWKTHTVVLTPERKAAMLAGRRAVPMTQASKDAVAEANRRRVITDETRAKMSTHRKGKPGVPHTEESKAKMSAKRLAYCAQKIPRKPHSEEAKENMRKAHQARWAAKKALVA